MKAKVKNEKMVRDMKNSALLSTDVDGILAYEKRKREILSERERLNTLENELRSIKELVNRLISNGNTRS